MAQALVLPGLCLTSAFPSWNRLQRLLFAIPLSLLLNHYLACVLVAFGVYGRISLFLVLATELCWLYRCHKKHGSIPIRYEPLGGLLEVILLVAGVAALTKYTQAWGRSFGDVFQMWDAFVSWNAWARSWSAGSLPGSGMYPNVMPITYSIPYVFLQRTDIESFSRASSGILFLGSIAALIELGFRNISLRRLAWVSAYLFAEIQAKFLQSHWQSGYADVPLATIIVFAFCFSTFEKREMPWIYGLIAGTAPLVKQPGLLFAMVSPLLGAEWKGWRESWSTSLRMGLRMALMTALAAGPWYVFIVFRIYGQAKDSNNVGFLASMVKGGFFDRWGFTLKLLTGYSSVSFLITIAILSIIGAAASRLALRWLLLLGIPYFLIWGTVFGYDIRNLAMSLFPFALAASAGLVFLLGKAELFAASFIPRISIPKIFRSERMALFVAFLTVVLTLISFSKPIRHWRESGGLLGWEKEQRIDLGEFPRSNRVLYALFNCEQLKNIPLYTNDPWLAMNPEFHGRVKEIHCDQILERKKKGEDGYAVLISEPCPGLKEKMTAFKDPIYSEPGLVYLFALNDRLPGTCGIP